MSIHQYTKPLVACKRMILNPEFSDALVDCFFPPDIRSAINLFNPEQLRIKNGWKTFNKIQKKLLITRFSFFTHPSLDNQTIVLGLVNKSTLVNIVSRYKEDFEEPLRAAQAQPQDLLDERKLTVFLKAIHGDLLIGTLLGFGRENALLFDHYRTEKIDPKERPMKGAWEEYEAEYLEHIARNNPLRTSGLLTDLFYPTFVCDPDSFETAYLKKIYQEDRERILNYYRGQDVVEATLSLLCKP